MGDDNHVAVKGDKADFIAMNRGQGDLTVNFGWKSTGSPTRFTTGALQASFEMLNGRGIGASTSLGETLDNGILYYMDKIDTFAAKVATAFNNVIPVYENGIKQGYKQLFSFGNDGMPTAANLTINSDWLENSAYITTNIHAPGEGENDTTFVSNMLMLFSKSHDFGEFSGTFSDYISFYTNSQLATDIDYYNNCLTISEEISDAALDQISSVSGVSLDEEGIDMTQWTKAYNAMSRVMTAMDEILETLINSTGLVGRG